MDADRIKDLIKNDSEYTVGALISLFNMQTADEAKTNSTAHQNDFGFNAFDAPILSDISKYYLNKGFLSDKQIRLVRSKLIKYVNQLATIGVKPLPIKSVTSTEKKRQRKYKRALKLDDSTVKCEFTFDQDLVASIKNFNGKKFNPKEKYWTVPLTITNLENLQELGFSLDKELADWYDSQTAGVTDEINIPGLNEVLRPFQKRAVSFIETKNGRALIADDMGLGKSLETIAWLKYRGEELFPILIICPATLKLNWYAEFAKWVPEFVDQIEIVSGQKPYTVKKPITIMNYDIAYHWYDYLLKNNTPKTIVADEIHACKSRGTGFKKIDGVRKKVVLTQRSYAVEELAKKAKYFIGLTGTLVLNRPVEAFNPLKMIKPTLFPNFRSYAYRYCSPSFNGFATVYTGASNTVELNQVLTREVMLRRRKQDVLKELPPKVRAIVPLEIDNESEYRSAERNFIQYLMKIDPEKAKRAKRAEALSQMNALIQLAVQGKMKESVAWIKDFIENDNKLVVFTWHQKTMDTLCEAFKKEKHVKIDGRVSAAKRAEAVEQFQQDEDTKLFFGQITAAGVGITLTAASNVAFIEYPWSPGLLTQAEDRCHRISQEDSVTIWNLVAHETVENSRVRLLEEKARVVSGVMDGDDSESAGLFNELIDQMMKGAK
jgi:SNF2 family DNA or RNA helicase